MCRHSEEINFCPKIKQKQKTLKHWRARTHRSLFLFSQFILSTFELLNWYIIFSSLLQHAEKHFLTSQPYIVVDCDVVLLLSLTLFPLYYFLAQSRYIYYVCVVLGKSSLYRRKKNKHKSHSLKNIQ